MLNYIYMWREKYMEKYFKQAQNNLKSKYGVDVIDDIILGSKDRVLLYTDISNKEDIHLHVISNSLKLVGLSESDQISMKELMNLIDYSNKYAEVSGITEYKKYIINELHNFDKSMNITIPVIHQNKRTWIHFDGFKVESNQNIYALFATNITELMEREEELYEKTHKDSLTKLFNKYAFDYHYGLRYHMDHLHILYIDIDDFKDINDQYSHHVGNEALIKMSDVLKQYETEHNKFYRLGGDEFVGLFFEQTEQVLQLANDILSKTKQIELRKTSKRFSVSMGIIKGTVKNDLVRKADDLLYQAKNNGKDQFVFGIEV